MTRPSGIADELHPVSRPWYAHACHSSVAILCFGSSRSRMSVRTADGRNRCQRSRWASPRNFAVRHRPTSHRRKRFPQDAAASTDATNRLELRRRVRCIKVNLRHPGLTPPARLSEQTLITLQAGSLDTRPHPPVGHGLRRPLTRPVGRPLPRGEAIKHSLSAQ